MLVQITQGLKYSHHLNSQKKTSLSFHFASELTQFLRVLQKKKKNNWTESSNPHCSSPLDLFKYSRVGGLIIKGLQKKKNNGPTYFSKLTPQR